MCSSFCQKQVLTGSIQNNCSKQQLKLPGDPAGVLEKNFLMDILLYKELRKAKLKTLKGKAKT